jgi:DNA-binding transcriptional MerR regulator
MKICVLNFSGNVGKSTIAAHLLQPRLNAPVFSVESLNVDASSEGLEVARVRGKHYNDLLQRLMKLDHAIVDVGSSNVEDFLKMMQHYADSQEEFDLFVVPVVKDGKQQADTVNTIRALRAIGVPAAKIVVLINKVEADDNLHAEFAAVFGFCASGEATVPEGAAIFANELFAMLKTHQLSIGALNEDTTDYRQRLREAADEEEQDAAIHMIAMKRLAKTCNKNLDAAFAALLPMLRPAQLPLALA